MVVEKCLRTSRSILIAGRVVVERGKAISGVVAARGIVIQRVNSFGIVLRACGIAMQRVETVLVIAQAPLCDSRVRRRRGAS